MFSACASSQISSIDSYSAFKENESGGGSVEDLLADMSESNDRSSRTASAQSSSHSSIMGGLSFSSDSDNRQSSHGDKKSRGKSASRFKMDLACELDAGANAPADTPIKARRTRSAMGSYIPPPGGHPLTRSFFASPGPAAYLPDYSKVKPSPPEVLLKFKHRKPIMSYGPGPGAYMITKECCPDTYNEQHFSIRFQNSESIGPGPASYDIEKFTAVGKYKPRAIIMSRPYEKRKRSSTLWPDLFGWTRFGKAHSPSAILVGNALRVPTSSPGPGAYDPEKCRDCRVGILIRGRPENNYKVDYDIPGPDKYMLPPTLSGPSWSIISRHEEYLHNDSPGPIYKAPVEVKKPISLTFRPFPWRGKEHDPSPNQYVPAGDQSIKTKKTAPSAVIGDRNYPDFGLWQRPGPNHYFPPTQIGFSSYNECSMKWRKPLKTKVQPGPADYNVPCIPPSCRRPAYATIPHKHADRQALPRSPGFIYTPKIDRGSVRDVTMTKRRPIRKVDTNDVPFYDLTGFTQKGKSNRIAISLKSRQSPFVYQGVTKTPCTLKDTCNLRSLKFEQPIKIISNAS